MAKKTMKSAAGWRAGVCVMDVTPPVGYILVGHGARNKPSERAHDPLKLKVLTVSDGKDRVAIVTSDLIDYCAKSVDRIRQMVKQRQGLDGRRVLLTASHTHTGPCTSYGSAFTPAEDVLPEYIRFVEDKIVGGILEATNSEQPVTLRWAEDRINIGAVNRRKMTAKGLQFAPNPDGPRDEVLNVLRFDRADGRPLAVLFRYTCHPTVLSSKIFQISADYPGVAQRVVESAYPGATAFFVQGCCGDVRPAIYRGDKFLGGTFGDVERMGRLLAAGVIRAAEQSAPVRGSGLDGRIRTLTLPFDSSMTPTRRNLDTLHRKYTRENKEWAGMGYVRKWTAFWRKQLAAGRRPQTGMPMDVHFIRIGEVTILGFGSEVMTEYGPWIRERVGGKLIVAGYANGVIGYLPTREALSQGGYEAVFHLFDNYPAPFAPEVQEMVIRAAEEIVKG